MWKLIVVALALPFIVFGVAKTCFKEMLIESFAAIDTVVAKDTSSNNNVNVPELAAVLVITMSVTTVVVRLGTVYRVVEEVAAAPLNSVFTVTAIIYCPFP